MGTHVIRNNLRRKIKMNLMVLLSTEHGSDGCEQKTIMGGLGKNDPGKGNVSQTWGRKEARPLGLRRKVNGPGGLV